MLIDNCVYWDVINPVMNQQVYWCEVGAYFLIWCTEVPTFVKDGN
jgi:hypothetical protein